MSQTRRPTGRGLFGGRRLQAASTRSTTPPLRPSAFPPASVSLPHTHKAAPLLVCWYGSSSWAPTFCLQSKDDWSDLFFLVSLILNFFPLSSLADLFPPRPSSLLPSSSLSFSVAMSAVDKCPFFKCPAFQLQDGGGPVITTIKTVWKHAGLPNPPKQFVEWIPGQTPLSTNKTVLVAVVTYLAVIFGGRELMR